MDQQNPGDSSNLKEPYPNFFLTAHQLLLGQIEFTRLRVLLLKIAIGILIAYIVLNVVVCVLTAILPLFGISILSILLRQIPFYTNGNY
jgi:hypothetical protein